MAIPAAQQPVYIGTVVADITRWSGNWSNRLAEVSTSATTGTRYANVRPDPQWSLDLPLDDPNYPEVIGWTAGLVITTMFFKHSSKADRLCSTTVEAVNKSADNNNDVPRVQVSGRGGDISYNLVVGAGNLCS